MDLTDSQDASPPCLPAALEPAQTSTTATLTTPITTEKVLPPANNLSSIRSSDQVLMTPRVNHQMEAAKEEPIETESTHNLGKQSPSPEMFNTYPHLRFQQPMLNPDQQQLQYHLSNAGFRSDQFGEDPQKLLRLAIYNARCASALATEATTKALTANVILNALMKQMQSPFAAMRSDQTSDGASGSSGSSSSGSAADGPTDDGFEINVDRISDSESIVNIRTH